MIIKKSDLIKTVNESLKEDLEFSHVTDASPDADKYEMGSETSINELVDADLAIIGNGEDEVNTPTDVTSNSTTDFHFSAVAQQNGKDRTNSQFGGLDVANTLIEDEEIAETAEIIRRNIYENFATHLNTQIPSVAYLNERYPIIARNLEVLIDSMRRRDVDPTADGIVLNELISSVNFHDVPEHIKGDIKRKL